MRIAVIGSGISGLASAWLLSRKHSVVLYESQDYLGGHTHTHRILGRDGCCAIDSGFIVYNTQHYPLFTRLLDELGVGSQPTSMSFAVRNEISGLEYNASTLNGLFSQRRNLVRPSFFGMVLDLLRFYREAPAVLGSEQHDLTLEDYLLVGNYGEAFRRDHLVPMASALWSCPPKEVLAFPVRHLVQFMANHQMLQIANRPTWRVVQGGSSQYVAAMRSAWNVVERISLPVRAVRRTTTDVVVMTDRTFDQFDGVVIACHSNQALALLADASPQERDILGAIPYQRNEVTLHTDTSLLPSKPSVWGAWNVLMPPTPESGCVVSYYMNRLQGLVASTPFVVSLNAGGRVDPHRVLRRMTYEHPVFSLRAVAAQKRKAEIQGIRRTWYAGAYWGWGFHEDGMRSAVAVAQALGVKWPAESVPTPDTAAWRVRAA